MGVRYVQMCYLPADCKKKKMFLTKFHILVFKPCFSRRKQVILFQRLAAFPVHIFHLLENINVFDVIL